MSLLPFIFHSPSRIYDQHFGHGLDLEELFDSMAMAPALHRHYVRPWRSVAKTASRLDSGSKITTDKDKYQVCLDVQQFAPNEISVKTVGKEIIVEGKHEEKEDEHGFISRHFVRKYALPDDFKPEDVVSSLSSDGVLSIVAPRNKPPAVEGERIVTITQTGPAHKTVQQQNKQEPEKTEQ